MTDRLDRGIGPDLLSQPADADVDDVGAGVEVVAPHFGEEPLATHDLADMDEQVMEEPELPVGQIRASLPDARLAPRDVEDDVAAAKDVLVAERGRSAQPDADAGEQLVERERLREVVVRARRG
jgi:hypothetical protein